MNFNNLFYGILIVGFSYLLTCPRVHKFSDIVKHDVLPKLIVEIINKYFKNSNSTFSKFPYNHKHGFIPQLKALQEPFIFSSTHLDLNLAIVSTTRLLL